jgi:hypothetical protein
MNHAPPPPPATAGPEPTTIAIATPATSQAAKAINLDTGNMIASSFIQLFNDLDLGAEVTARIASLARFMGRLFYASHGASRLLAEHRSFIRHRPY